MGGGSESHLLGFASLSSRTRGGGGAGGAAPPPGRARRAAAITSEAATALNYLPNSSDSVGDEECRGAYTRWVLDWAWWLWGAHTTGQQRSNGSAPASAYTPGRPPAPTVGSAEISYAVPPHTADAHRLASKSRISRAPAGDRYGIYRGGSAADSTRTPILSI